MSQALRKLTGSISRSRCMVIFINQIRIKIGVMFGNPETTTGGNALKFYASVRLDIRRIGAIKEREQIVGNQTRVKVVKNKMAPPFKVVEFDIMYGEGVSKRGELIDLGIQAGVVEKSGSWFSYDGQRIGQGRENAKTFLKENPAICRGDRARDPRQCRPRRRRHAGGAERSGGGGTERTPDGVSQRRGAASRSRRRFPASTLSASGRCRDRVDASAGPISATGAGCTNRAPVPATPARGLQRLAAGHGAFARSL